MHNSTSKYQLAIGAIALVATVAVVVIAVTKPDVIFKNSVISNALESLGEAIGKAR